MQAVFVLERVVREYLARQRGDMATLHLNKLFFGLSHSDKSKLGRMLAVLLGGGEVVDSRGRRWVVVRKRGGRYRPHVYYLKLEEVKSSGA